jgi:hypothetical protein
MNSRLLAVALVTSLAGLSACAQTSAVTWSPVLKLKSRQAIRERLAEPFGDVFTGSVGGAKGSVSNCNDYFRLSAKGFQPDNDQESRVLHNDAVECVALQLIQSARSPRKGPALGLKLDGSALSILPPELAPAVSNEMIAKAKAADEAGQSWSAYVPDAVAKSAGPGELDVSQTNWKTHLTLYATGDFTGAGQEEILLRADDQAVNGTYANSKLFLLAAGKGGAKRLRLVREVSVK